MKHLIKRFLTCSLQRKANTLLAVLASVFISDNLTAQPWVAHGNLQVQSGGRYFSYADGSPFFYMGDTAWELFHRLSREQVDTYLANRASKGINVIQAVALAELNGTTVPNYYGHYPLNNDNPDSPIVVSGANNDYWDHVDYVIDKAASHGIYIGLLPNWGSYVKVLWGSTPEIFNTTNGYNYGKWIAQRYGSRPNIIWICGGDRAPEPADKLAIFDAIARGVNDHVGSRLVTFHPQQWSGNSSSLWFHNAAWLDFNMGQSGHSERDFQDSHTMITADWNKTPAKPTMDGEPRYERHPVNWNTANGRFDDYDVRQAAYWSVFAGAAGHTYGHHSIWQFFGPSFSGISAPDKFWYDSLNDPGAGQMQHVKNLMLSRNYFSRVPDQSIISGDAGTGQDHMRACRGDGYAFIYFSRGQSKTINLNKISGSSRKCWWYNPRTGEATVIGTFSDASRWFDPPGGTVRGNDWILVVDDVAKNYPTPGTTSGGGTSVPDALNSATGPTSISGNGSYTVTVNYGANAARDIVVDLTNPSNGGAWYGGGRTTVQAGSGDANVVVTVSGTPPTGTTYIWNVQLRPVGGDWSQTIQYASAPVTVGNTVSYPQGVHTMRHLRSSKHLESWDNINGATVYLNTYWNSDSFSWDIIDINGTYARIVNKRTGKALKASQNALWAPVVAATYENTDNFMWKVVPRGAGYALESKFGYSLEIWSTDFWATAYLNTYWDSDSFRFTLEKK